MSTGSTSSTGTTAILVDQPVCSFGYFGRQICGNQLTSTEIKNSAPALAGAGRYCSDCVQRIMLRRSQYRNSIRKRRADSKSDVMTKRCSCCNVLANKLLQDGISFRPDYKTCDRCLKQAAAKRRRLAAAKATVVLAAAASTSNTSDIETETSGSNDELESVHVPSLSGAAPTVATSIALGKSRTAASSASTSEVAGTIDMPSSSSSMVFDAAVLVTPRATDVHMGAMAHRDQVANLPSSVHSSTGQNTVKSPPVTQKRLFKATPSPLAAKVKFFDI